MSQNRHVLLVGCVFAIPIACAMLTGGPSIITVADAIVSEAEHTSAYASMYRPPAGHRLRRLWEHLCTRAGQLGVQVIVTELDADGLIGQTAWPISGGPPIVFVSIDLDEDARAEVLAHELAHVVGPQVLRGTREGEALADIVAGVVVARGGGLDVAARFGPYNARHKAILRALVQTHRAEIEQMVKILEAAE